MISSNNELTTEYKAFLYEAAKRGLLFLDVTQPDWRDNIDIPKLNMCTNCIVTQLTGTYSIATLEELGIIPVFDHSDRSKPNNEVDLGFYADLEGVIDPQVIYAYLTMAWTELLLQEPR